MLCILNTTSLCGRGDGRTICGPLRVPKSTYVTLAHKRKPKFFYFGCALIRRCKCKQSISAHGTDGQTDGQTDKQTDRVRRNMRPPPREEGRIKTYPSRRRYLFHIRLLIITMTERIMYRERHAEYIKQTRKRTIIDTSNECQYTCLYNIRTMKLIIKFSEFRNELSIMGSGP